jgi:hypothetical protein
MGLERRYLDVLQNIEFAIVSVYKEQSDLHDYEVMRALDASIEFFRAEARGHTPKEVSLPARETVLFNRISDMCHWRMGRGPLEEESQLAPEEQKTADEIVACLRKIRKSVDRWNKQGGRQGYLQFVNEYVK